MKITKLQVKNFRHIQNQTIEFGNRITVITGQNGTGKSSLLGWIAQACDFKPKIYTLTGKSFKSKYSEIFRFCKENDYDKEYNVSLFYMNDTNKEQEKNMKTRFVPKTAKGPERYRVDFDGRNRALNFPVIYLGLKRLIPLATENNIKVGDLNLTTSEKNLFSRLAKEILILLDKTIKTEQVKSINKDVLAMKTSKYSHLGNSAGQDNIGQIISSMISFQRLQLQSKQDNKYKGGVLLIDEIDATLYAGSQIHLIRKLFDWSRDKNLQIVFTTHSLEILEFLSEKTGDDTKINFLELKDGLIVNRINPAITFLKNKIKSQIGKKDKIEKIEMVCEDEVTEYWCKNLLNGTEVKQYLNIKKGPFGAGNLQTMAESNHPIFKNMFFVMDGDKRDEYKSKKIPDRTVFLPLNKKPEKVFYDFLYNLSDNDDFWDDELNFSKQTCFQNYQNTNVKRWFQDPELKDFFGRSYSKLLNKWKKENKQLVEKFQEEVLVILESYL